VSVETIVDGESRTFDAEDLFVATGIRPNSENIGLDTIGVDTDDRGAVVVDEHFRTANPESTPPGTSSANPNWRQSPRKRATTR
jgi:mercuric reductase